MQDASGVWHTDTLYHIIDATDPAKHGFSVLHVPQGTYNKMRFTFGVDSTMDNHRDPTTFGQDNDLASVNHQDMYWQWGELFIQLHARRLLPACYRGQATSRYSFHMAGTKAPFTIEFPFANKTFGGTQTNLHVNFNAKQIWQDPGVYDLNTNPNDSGHGVNDGLSARLSASIKEGVFTLKSVGN